MTAERHIDYEALAQGAMRGIVRTVLGRVAKSGLPGEHHFYIAFNTEAPGVVISKRLKQKYPEEMTVVLQHRFWDLTVTEERFEVKLTFDGIPERHAAGGPEQQQYRRECAHQAESTDSRVESSTRHSDAAARTAGR